MHPECRPRKFLFLAVVLVCHSSDVFIYHFQNHDVCVAHVLDCPGLCSYSYRTVQAVHYNICITVCK